MSRRQGRQWTRRQGVSGKKGLGDKRGRKEEDNLTKGQVENFCFHFISINHIKYKKKNLKKNERK